MSLQMLRGLDAYRKDIKNERQQPEHEIMSDVRMILAQNDIEELIKLNLKNESFCIYKTLLSVKDGS
jgi:hypothetical protein